MMMSEKSVECMARVDMRSEYSAMACTYGEALNPTEGQAKGGYVLVGIVHLLSSQNASTRWTRRNTIKANIDT